MLRFLKKTPETDSDEALLARYRATDDMQWLAVLFHRYLELVYGVCLKYLENEAEAEDAVMAVFEQLIEKVKKHDITNFKSWLHVLTKNHCLMQLRKAGRNLTLSFEPAFMHSMEVPHLISEIEQETDDYNALHQCLEQLPDKQKQCIQAFYLDGKSYKEIADNSDEDIGRIRSYIQNGRRNLKICLEKDQS